MLGVGQLNLVRNKSPVLLLKYVPVPPSMVGLGREALLLIEIGKECARGVDVDVNRDKELKLYVIFTW